MNLPGGFSPISAIKQVGSIVNPTGGVADYDVFSEKSVMGGVRSPANGALIGPQAPVTTPGWQPESNATGGVPTAQFGSVQGATITPAQVAAQEAAAAQAAATTQKRNNFGATAGGYVAGAQTGARDVVNGQRNATEEFLNGIRTGQEGINTSAANNQLNLRQSMNSIVNGLQTGIRSGGVSLANMNASDSGAADAMARAWAKVGNNQAAGVTGEAAAVDEDLQRQQGALQLSKEQGERRLDTTRDTEVNRVRNDLGSKLQLLRAQADAEGVGDAVDTGAVDRVVAEAIAQLAGIDQMRSQGLGTVRATTAQEAAAEAARLDALGQAGKIFNIADANTSWGTAGGATQGVPGVQGLPIYTRRNDDQQVAPGLVRREQLVAA